MPSSQEELARSIAVDAHAGQTDKGGMPYIGHPAHVASMVDGDACKAVAWLHDVIEDTCMTACDLISRGVSSEVVEAVSAMTHMSGEPYADYIERVRRNPIARQVKIADLRHNMDTSRLPEVGERDRMRIAKYRKALDALAP